MLKQSLNLHLLVTYTLEILRIFVAAKDVSH